MARKTGTKKKPAASSTKRKAKARALVLLSGGLDSRLVCKMMQSQLGSRQVEAVFFQLPFGGGCCSDSMCVVKFCQTQGIRLHIIDCTKGAMYRRYMAMIMKPRFGRGTAFNPCIDCHLFMLKEAKKLAGRIGADVIATGEVLGERPMSQKRHALELIERESGLSGRLLRPLSAKLLPETEAEKKGWIDRSRLLVISGRSRSVQLALAKKYRIDFPTPGGGCLLTDASFSERLAGILRLYPNAKPDEIELAKLGRHFPIGKVIIIVGRNHQENLKIQALAKALKLTTVEAEGVMGPTTVMVSKKPAKPATIAAALLTARYSDAPKGLECSVCVKCGKKMSHIRIIAPQDTGFLLKKRRMRL